MQAEERRDNFVKRVLYLALIFVLLLVGGCYWIYPTEERWEYYTQLNTVTAYEEFLQKYPDSIFAEEARRRIAQAKIEAPHYEKAKKLDTIKAYEEFLKKYPDSIFANKARTRIEQLKDELAYKKAKKQNTPDSYFSYLTTYPKGRFAELAEKAILTTLPTYVRKEVEKLLSRDPVQRAYGAYNLGKMGKRAVYAIPFLIKILDDATWLERKERGRGFFRDLFSGYVSTTPAEEAAEALVKIGKPAVEPLITALKDENRYVQTMAAEALGKIGDQRAVEPLITALKDVLKDEDDSERYLVSQSVVAFAAAEALSQIGKPAVEPLISALKDENSDVRYYAAYAFSKMKDPWVVGPRAVEPLISLLKDRNRGTRWNALKALRRVTGKNFGEDPTKWQKWWEENKEITRNGR
mgnify:CR=1 FL=1